MKEFDNEKDASPEFSSHDNEEEKRDSSPSFEKTDDEGKDLGDDQHTEIIETTGADSNEPEPKPVSWKKEALDWAISIAAAIVIALIIRNFVFIFVNVDGQSMIPTLNHGDTLYVNRFMYTPKQGDIIILHPPQNYNTPYVKRVIALEGQTVDIRPDLGEVYVDGELLTEPYASEPITSGGSLTYPYTVKEGHVFILGDNRSPNGSSDSRVLGPIPLKNIMGKAIFRVLPIKNFGSLYK